MNRVTNGVGIILIAIGGISYLATAFASLTALIPAVLGLIMLGCAWVINRNDRLGTILALIFAVLGLGGTFMNVLDVGELAAGEADNPAAIIASTLAFIFLVVFVVYAIGHLVNMRRSDIGTDGNTDQPRNI